MPVPQLPVELIQLIVADPVLTKADLQSLSLTARAFPPLVRPRLFKQLEIPLGWIPEDDAFPNPDDYGPALTLDEMDRLMSLRRRPDLAELVKEVFIAKDTWLEPPPGSIRVTAHDLMQLVYIIFTRLEEVGTTEEDPFIAPPRHPLPCCQTLHTLHNVSIDAHTWISLQTCSALRRLSIAELSLRHGVPAMPPSSPFKLVALELSEVYDGNTVVDFLRPFLRACPNLTHLWLGSNYDIVPDLSTSPKLVSLIVTMRDDDAFLQERRKSGRMVRDCPPDLPCVGTLVDPDRWRRRLQASQKPSTAPRHARSGSGIVRDFETYQL